MTAYTVPETKKRLVEGACVSSNTTIPGKRFASALGAMACVQARLAQTGVKIDGTQRVKSACSVPVVTKSTRFLG